MTWFDEYLCLAIWSEENGTMRPLDERVLNRIKTNWSTLTEFITLEGGLVAELYANNCITKRQKQLIEAAEVDVDKNDRLLQIISRKSVANFNRFVEYLQDTQQGHVAALLLNEDAGKPNVNKLFVCVICMFVST